MRRLVLVLMAVASMALVMGAQHSKARTASAATVARGKYLVENVAICADCHSPRDAKGEFTKGEWLQGAPLGFKPVVPMPVWADTAPHIAGLPGWEKDAAIKFLMTGVAYNGLPARPPMPRYRFNLQDAQAIVAYLKSLEPGK